MLGKLRRAPFLLGAVLSGTVLATAPAAAATVSSVSGLEVAATSTVGTFVGTVTDPGESAGAFRAVVAHQPVPTAVGASSAITGGSLWLRRWDRDGMVQTVTGTFTGGSITLESGATGCVDQTYAVAGKAGTTAGPADFDVTLTHYRTWLFGECLTYGATIAGTLTL